MTRFLSKLQQLARDGSVLQFYLRDKGFRILDEAAFVDSVGGTMANIQDRLQRWGFRSVAPLTIWMHPDFGASTDVSNMRRSRSAVAAALAPAASAPPRRLSRFILRFAVPGSTGFISAVVHAPEGYRMPPEIERQLQRALVGHVHHALHVRSHLAAPTTPYFRDGVCTETCECAVCQSSVESGTTARTLTCGHTFHVPCAAQWAATRLESGRPVACATCRSEFN